MPKYFFDEGMPLPAPSPDGLDKGFWEACKRHEMVVQQCSDCSTMQHTPEWVCYKCLSPNSHWQKVSGKGKVYSYMNVAHSVHRATNTRIPFNVILVELNDAQGIRMVGNLVDATYEEIYIGMPVEVYFEDHPEADITLPLWKRADGRSGPSGKEGRERK